MVLAAIHVAAIHGFAFSDVREAAFGVFFGLSITGVCAVNGEVTGEDQVLSASPEDASNGGAFARFNLQADGAVAGVRHLTGDESLPDEGVNAHLVGVERAAKRLWGAGWVSRSNRFVRFLSALCAGAVDAFFGWHVLVAPALADVGAGHAARLRGDVE